ncbi:hypothetical protein A3J77_00970 [Candidatus Wolfebacteria bacterium RBG_13_41_7]|uniref:Uncharacterized protein n=1 Tax=Candidatus Wolfebacteria bacterium RBG_13_41_7 TaxID=1802554 RepID=A0A1F8DP42_9BACT|nr:MAG: hypothetical protein A3J77_00970 [Candidatus Wolfebacteria bacterium RBG_13_41_7]
MFCKFCGGEVKYTIRITNRSREKWIYLCEACKSKMEVHGIVVCEKCGNLYLRNDGDYRVEYISDCKDCHISVPYAFRNGVTA